MRWTLIIHINGWAPASTDAAIKYAKPIIALYSNRLRRQSLNHVLSAETYTGSVDRLGLFPCLYIKRSTSIIYLRFFFARPGKGVCYFIANVEQCQIKAPDAIDVAGVWKSNLWWNRPEKWATKLPWHEIKNTLVMFKERWVSSRRRYSENERWQEFPPT